MSDLKMRLEREISSRKRGEQRVQVIPLHTCLCGSVVRRRCYVDHRLTSYSPLFAPKELVLLQQTQVQRITMLETEVETQVCSTKLVCVFVFVSMCCCIGYVLSDVDFRVAFSIRPLCSLSFMLARD